MTTSPLPDKHGRFGPFGGRFVPETLMTALDEHSAAVGDFRTERGCVAGHFDVTVARLGDFTIFLPLKAACVTVQGRPYFRHAFGQVLVPVEVVRE